MAATQTAVNPRRTAGQSPSGRATQRVRNNPLAEPADKACAYFGSGTRIRQWFAAGCGRRWGVPASQARSRAVTSSARAALFCCLAEAQGLLIVVDGLDDPTAPGQSNAQVLLGLGVVGLDFQGRLEMGHRLVDPAAPAKAVPRLIWASA